MKTKSIRLDKEAGIIDEVKKGLSKAISYVSGDKESHDSSEPGHEYNGSAHVSSPYGKRSIKQLGGKPHMHGGVDLSVGRGTPVYSVYDGVVNSKPYWNDHKGGMGGYDLSIRSSGEEGEFLMQYIHLDKVLVTQGQSIKAGQKIGETGTAGTGPHLHLQKRLLPGRETIPPTHEEEEASLHMRIVDRKDQKHPTSGLHKTRPVIVQSDSLSVPAGTTIHAIKDGIASVHVDATEGSVITVADPVFYGIGNFFGFGKDDAYVYSGFSSTRVKDGDEIKAGQVIGVARPLPRSPGKSYVRITKKVDGSRVAIPRSDLQSAIRTSEFSKIPREGITSTNASRPVDAPVKGTPGARDQASYDDVIDQFQVDKNPRYTPRAYKPGGPLQTFCNIFVWDVTAAMGSPLPHWVDKNGNPAQPGRGNHELNGNASVDWLAQHGSRFGWKEVDEQEAQEYANKGHPVVAGQKEIGKSRIGHVAIVRPGKITKYGPSVANAGGRNINKAQVAQVFGAGYKNGLIRYWANLA